MNSAIIVSAMIIAADINKDIISMNFGELSNYFIAGMIILALIIDIKNLLHNNYKA